MVSQEKILVRVARHGNAKSWLWDSSKPLQIRRPISLSLTREGADVFVSSSGEDRTRVGTWGEACRWEPGKGSSLALNPISKFSPPTKVSEVTGASQDLRGILAAVLLSAFISLVVWFQFHSFLSEKPNLISADPEKEMRVQVLPARVSLPLPPPMISKEPLRMVFKPGSSGGGAPNGPLGRNSGRKGNGIGSKTNADLIRDAFGNLTFRTGVPDTSAVESVEGKPASESSRRTRFGFGKSGKATGSEKDALNSTSQVMHQLTESFEKSVPTIPSRESMSALVNGSGRIFEYSGARVDGQGNSPILVDLENLSVGEGLTHEEVQEVIQSKIGEVRRCQEIANRTGKAFEGKVVVNFSILPNGSLKDVSLSQEEKIDSQMRGCLLRKISAWKFQNPRGGREVEVSYPFVFMTLEGESP